MKVIPVAQKLSIADERHQDQRCLLERGDHKNGDRNPENLPWVRISVTVGHVTLKLNIV